MTLALFCLYKGSLCLVLSYGLCLFGPLRGMRYLNVKKITIKVLFRRFRPLAGIKVSELKSLGVVNNDTVVSVPSRGLRHLNEGATIHLNSHLEFPSPLGEQGI